MSGRSADRTRDGARGGLALAALLFLLAVTAAWWALALWPLSDAAPAWLARTREICFGAARDGRPDAAGWTALIAQPLIMIGTLTLVWGHELAAGLRRLARRPPGRALLAALAVLLLAGATAAARRALEAADGLPGSLEVAVPAPSYPRLDRPAPPLRLVNQHGDTVTLEQMRGRIVLVTFAFAHCTTLCPLVVNEARRAQEALDDPRPALWVVTLDPWRDTPARLPHLAESWGLGTDAFALSGAVDHVNAVLDEFNIARSRDPRTGEITHPALVYLVDASGTLAYATTGNAHEIVALARRL